MRIVIILFILFAWLTSSAQDFSLVPYRVGTFWGYSDSLGNMVIQPKYQRSFPFSKDGLARVLLESKYGFINRAGELLSAARYDSATDFRLGGALVWQNGKKY